MPSKRVSQRKCVVADCKEKTVSRKFYCLKCLRVQEAKKEFESAIQGKMGPIVFKIALEQDNIKELIQLLKQVFVIFDRNGDGTVGKSELNVLAKVGLICTKGLTRLSAWDTDKDKNISFKEFLAFFSSECVNVEAIKELEAEAKAEAKGDSKAAKEPPLPDYLRRKLSPLAFRLACRQTDLERAFGLFKQLFDVFDSNKDGCIDANELKALVACDLLSPDDLAHITKLDVDKSGKCEYPEFLAFMVRQYVEGIEAEEAAAEAALRSKGGPVLFKIALEQGNIKEVFELLKQVFDLLDANSNGEVDTKELQVLKVCGLLDEGALKRLGSWDTNKDGVIQFREFAAFFSAELVADSVEMTTVSHPSEAKEMPPKFRDTLAPVAFRLACKEGDLKRIFKLFKKLFDLFDSSGDGKVDPKEMAAMLPAGVLSARETDELMAWDRSSKGFLTYAEFLAFWIGHHVDEMYSSVKKVEVKEKMKLLLTSDLQSKLLAPVIFRLACQREAAKTLFKTIQQFFSILDVNKDGLIDPKEISNLLSAGFLDESGVKSLHSADANHDGMISLSEFLVWMASDFSSEAGISHFM